MKSVSRIGCDVEVTVCSAQGTPRYRDGLAALFCRKGNVVSFGIYSIGLVLVIGGLTYAAYLMHVPAHWIVAGAIVLLGVGVLTGVKATRQKDPSG
jgi:hypothetical protein